MYTENRVRDVFLVCRAIASNQLARFAPGLYVRLTRQTGRGEGEESARQVAEYFFRCFEDYREQLGLTRDEMPAFLAGKSVLEYGPGDALGVALLFSAFGAHRVTCVDQFPLVTSSSRIKEIYENILAILPEDARQRAESVFETPGDVSSGFRVDKISYRVTRNGLSGADNEFDLVISRAALEHVSDLTATLRDVSQAMKVNAVSVHEVDLTSHGLDRYLPLDFLTWPDWLFALMYDQKGFPNRFRTQHYKDRVIEAGLEIDSIVATGAYPLSEAERIFAFVAPPFRRIPVEELAWKGFRMVLRKTSNSRNIRNNR